MIAGLAILALIRMTGRARPKRQRKGLTCAR